ncbi:Thioredoxin [Pedobacter steynii]|uniref:Thioredoxin n=1 Tax=Pedobacter steynii TaxID=430522 RepID=A0A1G9NVP4_9SPHI|nr:thioredoxin fold domain-containing protein [Pedobacter steynii]NQX39186.1 thioredoxin fold domain-containing protein [Pedobacter steynii]SDL90097.1 Thioredoxin [Pedobacter steynii]
MKTIFSIFLLLLSGAVMAQQPSAAAAAQWDKILGEAKAQHKIILIDFSTSWCGPCKAMDQRVFPDQAVASTLQQHYRFIKLDAETDELGRVLAARYMVRSYPSFLIIDPSLKVLRKESGYKAADKLNSWLLDATTNQQQRVPGFSQKKYLDFPSFYLSAFGEKKDRKKADSNVVRSYLDQQKDLTAESAWAVMNAFEMPEKYFKYFMANYPVYKKKYGKSIEGKMAYGLFPELQKAINSKSTEAFVAVLNRIPQFFDEAGVQQSTYLFNIPREPAFFIMKANFLDTAKTITPEIRMESATGILMDEHLPAAVYEKAAGWLLNYPGIEQSNDISILMSLALVYQRNGNKDKALAFFQKGEKIGGTEEGNKEFINYYKKRLTL